MLVFADPTNKEARYLCADALEQLGYKAESSTWRNAYLCAAQELRLGTNTDPANRSSGMSDAISHMTPEIIFDYLGILVDTKQIEGLSFTANVQLSEGNYILRVKNGVLLYQKNALTEAADVTWKTTRLGLLTLLTKNNATITKAIKQQGDTELIFQLSNAIVVTSAKPFFNIVEP